MLYSIDHSVGVARDLADDLALKSKGSATINTVRQAQDALGWPMMFLSVGGNEAEGQPVIALRISGAAPAAIDVFGNTTIPFTPHQCEIAYELNAAGAPTPAQSDIALVMAQVARTGIVIANEAIAHGTAVSEAAMNAALASAQVIKDLDWALKGNT